MITLDFECKKCKQVYEELVVIDPTNKYKNVKCPNCKSKSKIKLLCAPSFNFTNPVGTDRWCSEDTGHDYRYNYSQKDAKQKRAAAAKKSHMGANPYNEIDDISSGKYFGEVK